MIATKTIRGYELREQIGRGGFGIVYRAYQAIVEREVAIKVILPQFVNNPDFVRSFETEAQMIARLEHPFVVPLFDYWREPDGAYLVMRFLHGGSWRNLLKPQQPVPAARMADMLLQVAAALDAAHRAQIIHRDIKPENILLDTEGNTYLADFGIAKKLDPTDDSEAGQFRGTIAYTAPEIIESSRVSPASDIYSLGYTVHEMLAGQHALTDQSAAEMLAWHLELDLPLIASASEAVNRVLQRATAKDPSVRYTTAQSMAREFFDAVHQNSPSVLMAPTVNIVTNPYKGLRSFDESDARDFFGREVIIEQIINHLSTRNFLTVVGPSGSGKSSVVRAGVLPALREGRLDGSDDWFIVTMVPGAEPLQQLKTALLKVAFDPSDTLTRILTENDSGLTDAIENILEIKNPLMLVIDQFEEVFTLVDDEAERQHFLTLLYQAVTAPNSSLKLLITLRADFYDRPLLYEDFGALVQTATQVVLPLRSEELQQAILYPAKRIGIEFESELVAAIVSDVRQEPGALPLLQYALTELFEQRSSNRLNLAEYQKSGGVSGALARRAEDVYQALSDDERMIAQQIFLRLVNPGEGTEDTRRRARYSELMAIGNDRKRIQAVLDAFGKYRLLTFDNDIETREPTIEVAHEALIREWRQLRSWLNDSRNDLRLQRMLATLLNEWRSAKFDKGLLLYGTRLAQFEEWAKTSHLTLSQEERAFLDASVEESRQRKAAEAERQARELTLERRSRQRLQAFVGLLVLASIVGIGLLVQATRKAVEAESLRQSAQAQQLESAGDVGPALAMALDSVRIANPPPLALDNLIDVAYKPGLRQRIVAGKQPVVAIAVSTDGRYVLSGTGASDSPNQPGLGRPPADQAGQSQQGGPPSGGQGGPPAGGQGGPPPAGGQGGPPAGGQGGPPTQTNQPTPTAPGNPPPPADNQPQQSAPTMNALILWDMQTGQQVTRLEETLANITDVQFVPSDDGVLKAVSASDDGKVTLWDVKTGKALHETQLPAFDKITLSLSDDGLLYIVGGKKQDSSGAGLNVLVDIKTWQQRLNIPPQTDVLWTGVISHDGTFAISSYIDGTQIVWDTKTGQELRRFTLGKTDIKTASYTIQLASDNATAAITTGNNQTWLWDVSTGGLLNRLPSGTVVTQRALFSADHTKLISASQDGILRVWDLESGTLAVNLNQRDAGYQSMVLSESQGRSGGTRAIMGGLDGSIYVWDIDETKVYEIQEFMGQPAKQIALLPDGQQMLTFGPRRADGQLVSRLTLWDVKTGTMIRTFEGRDTYVPQALAVSPDGRTALTGSSTHAPGVKIRPDLNNDMILWDLSTGKEIRRLSMGDTKDVLDIAFHPTNSNLAISTHSIDIVLWQVDTGAVIRTFQGHKQPVKGLAFIGDGKTFASVGDDGILRIWDVETGAVVRSIDIGGRQGFVCITPDGTSALVSSVSSEMVLWDLTAGTELHRLKGHTDGVLGCAISSDGKWGLSGSWDNTFILWNLTTGEIIHRYTQHNAAIWDVAFSPDQQSMFSVGEGAGVIQWRTQPVQQAEVEQWVAANRVLPQQDEDTATPTVPPAASP